jgi:thiol peroxidase
MATQTAAERSGAITFQGGPLTLIGTEVRAGDPAPEFVLTTQDLQPFTLEDATAGGTRAALLVVVPSLDTQVCSIETQTFHRRLAELPAGTAAYVVSRDLPFAQQRWAAANEATGLNYLSDYRERHFGPAYGVAIKELELLARAVFVIGPDRKIAYVEVVKEVTDEPDYDAVFKALGAL